MSQEASGLKEDKKKVLKRAFFMASGTLTSRILGLLRDIALGALFDRAITDAWTAAFRIPNLFRRLFGEGSLAVSFIPVFMEAQRDDSQGVRARNLANGFYTLLLLSLGVFTLLGVIYADEIFRFLLSADYEALPQKWDLTVRMGRIMFGFIFFVCTYAYYMGILNALGSFGLPAVAPALLNISMLVFTFMPSEWFPGHGDGLAWGVVVGGILQALLLWGALRARNYLPQMQGKIWSQDIQQVLRNLIPGVVGMGLMHFSTVVNLYFASSLKEGSISYIYWADRLLELPLSLVSVSLGAALLPTLSDLAARKDWRKFQETSRETFLMTLFLAWPAALGLFFLAEPIVEVLFMRGRFTTTDVQSTAGILKIYAVSLVLISLSRILMTLYFSIRNTWFPALVSVLCLGLQVAIAPWLMREQGLVGLVTSGMFSALLNVVLLFGGLGIWSLSLPWQGLVKPIFKFACAGMGLIVSVQLYESLSAQMERGQNTLALVVTIVLAVISYFTLAALLRCDEFTKIRPLFRR